jgi:RNA polymerase sigma-70 factor (ECF subfamily)
MIATYQIADYVGNNVKKLAKSVQAKIVVSDDQLVERARNNDDGAFNELVRRHQNFVNKIAYGYVNDSELARDVAQDVFIKAYRGLEYFESDSRFTTWLYKICRNHCLNLIRRRRLEVERLAGPDLIADAPDHSLKARIKNLIGKLSDEYREIIILRYYGDLKYDEIAERLDLPLSTVKVRLFRAKQELKSLAGVK